MTVFSRISRTGRSITVGKSEQRHLWAEGRAGSGAEWEEHGRIRVWVTWCVHL